MAAKRILSSFEEAGREIGGESAINEALPGTRGDPRGPNLTTL
jgi:hypothetical protein